MEFFGKKNKEGSRTLYSYINVGIKDIDTYKYKLK